MIVMERKHRTHPEMTHLTISKFLATKWHGEVPRRTKLPDGGCALFMLPYIPFLVAPRYRNDSFVRRQILVLAVTDVSRLSRMCSELMAVDEPPVRVTARGWISRLKCVIYNI
jgi:hypothetical protein